VRLPFHERALDVLGNRLSVLTSVAEEPRGGRAPCAVASAVRATDSGRGTAVTAHVPGRSARTEVANVGGRRTLNIEDIGKRNLPQ
jgi:hypothetical protein